MLQFAKELAPISVKTLPLAKMTVSKFLQLSKAFAPIVLNEEGKVIDFKFLLAKAPSLIDVILASMTIFSSSRLYFNKILFKITKPSSNEFSQAVLAKASLFIVLALVSISIKDKQFKKALASIF